MGRKQAGNTAKQPRFNQWNPVLHFDVVHGEIAAEVLRERTISMTITDNARRFDEIEWVLRNNDGELTKLESMALGLVVRVRWGYKGYTGEWRTFIISRIRGGVGSTLGEGTAPFPGTQETSTITMSGRNRNAPNAKSKKSKKSGGASEPVPGKTGKSKANPRRGGKSSTSITRYDDAARSAWNSDVATDRIFQVRRVSHAVKEIAKRLGYAPSRTHIQETEEIYDTIVIPMGMSYAVFVKTEAEEREWRFLMDGKTFRFHDGRSLKHAKGPKFLYRFGADGHVLDVSLDADFLLPTFNKIKTSSMNVRTRNFIESEINYEKEKGSSGGDTSVASSFAIIDVVGAPGAVADPVRRKVLQRDGYFAVTGGMNERQKRVARSTFYRRNIRAMHITLRVVGNPFLVGGDSIQLEGTGSKIVDRIWYIESARHIYDGQTYVSELALRLPKKYKVGNKKTVTRSFLSEKEGSTATLDVVSDPGSEKVLNKS